MRALITGGNGYFGRLLIRTLLDTGHECVSVDLQEGTPLDPRVAFIPGDAASPEVLEQAIKLGQPDVIFHLASQIDFAVKSQNALHRNNVESTRAVSKLAARHRIPKVIFTSSNSVYLGNRLARPITESDTPIPIDEYGKSKVESERILLDHSGDFDSVIFRCPNIVDAGRVGLLSILFDFISEGRRCWVLGRGEVRHQCIYAQDLIDACMKAIAYPGSATFNIGSDDVPSFREMFEFLIARAGTSARVSGIPKAAALPLMRIARRLRMSPLGEYQFRMLTMDFQFDTSKCKTLLGWSPTLNNGEMLWKAYEFYHKNREAILDGRGFSANGGAIKKLGIIRLLKLIS